MIKSVKKSLEGVKIEETVNRGAFLNDLAVDWT